MNRKNEKHFSRTFKYTSVGIITSTKEDTIKRRSEK